MYPAAARPLRAVYNFTQVSLTGAAEPSGMPHATPCAAVDVGPTDSSTLKLSTVMSVWNLIRTGPVTLRLSAFLASIATAL